MDQGMFITVEGIEGAGKSTHAGYIAKQLADRGRRICSTREPGGTRAGERIREVLMHAGDITIDPLTELLLVFASRAQHLQEIIEPALGRGETVVCDRFTDSTFAYQGGGRGIDVETISRLAGIVQGGRRPDLTFLFDVPVETGLARARRRGQGDRFEGETIDFFTRVRDVYLSMQRAEPDRIELIDASRGIADIQSDIRAVLSRRAPQ